MRVPSTSAGRDIPGRLLSYLETFPVTMGVVLASLALSLIPALPEWATWHAAAPFGLQVWLCHFTHWSPGHLLWDILTFTVLAALIEKTDRRLLVRLLVWVPPAIMLVVGLAGGFASYRGLSGLDCGLYTGLIVHLRQQRRMGLSFTLLALGLLIGKGFFEILTGATLFVSDLPTGISPVPLAHLAGALTGVACAVRMKFWFSRPKMASLSTIFQILKFVRNH